MAERRGERGSTAPLIIGFAVMLIVLVAVVTDATAAFVRRQALDSLADGAALRGADVGASGVAAYAEADDGERLRETESAAQTAVDRYLRETGAYARFPDLTYAVSVDPVDRSVHVRLRAVVDLPLAVPGVVRRAPVTASGTASVTRDP